MHKADAQECVLRIEIKDEKNKPMELVTLSVNNIVFSTSDKSGIIVWKEKCNHDIGQLKLSHIAYLDQFVSLKNLKNDTTIKIVMRERLMQLPVTEIRGKSPPDTIIGNNQYYVEDFVFSRKWILTILKSRKNPQYFLELRTLDGMKIYGLKLDEKPIKLFKDALQICYLVFEKSAKEIYYDQNGLSLRDINFDDFWWLHNFINQADENNITLNNQFRQKPWFEYYLIDRSKQSKDTLYAVKHDFYYEQYHSEYAFLSTRERHHMKRLEYKTGESRYDLAAHYTGFANNIWFKETKAPYFFHNDRHLVFDFNKDSLFIFMRNGSLLSKHHLQFHKNDGFKQEIVFDDEFGEFYALRMKNGKKSLHRIIINTKVEISFAGFLSMRYPSHVKVKGGRAWYLSRPSDSWQSTYLYAESLE
ncbi:MAG: hypothetical protein ACK4GL_05470 [Flavobacteriales bacterium]